MMPSMKKAGKAPAVPEVHMSPERRAEFKKQYPTPELRAQARARIKAGRPARLAAKAAAGTVTTSTTSVPSTTSKSGNTKPKPKVTTTVTNTTLTNTTGINPSTPAAARKVVETLIKAQKAKAKTPAAPVKAAVKSKMTAERAMAEAQIRKVYGGKLPY